MCYCNARNRRYHSPTEKYGIYSTGKYTSDGRRVKKPLRYYEEGSNFEGIFKLEPVHAAHSGFC